MAAPLLTPAQFARTPVGQKPGASYHGYVSYVTQTRAARAAAAMNPMTRFYNALKAAPGLAKTDVTQQINAALAGERASTKIAQDQANRQAARAQAAAQGVADLTGKYWQGASQLYGALGSSLTGAVGDAQRAQAAKTAADVAQATGGQSQLSTMDLGGLHNTEQYGDVLLPATSMGEEAALQSRSAGAQINAIADQYRQKTIDAQTALTAKRAALEAQRPSLYTAALTARQNAARSDLQALTSAGYINTQIRNMQAGITGRDPVTGRPTLAATVAQNKADAAINAASAKAAQQRITNALNRSKLKISQQTANAATKREAAYEANLRWHQAHPNSAGKKSGSKVGMSDASVRQYGKSAAGVARTLFYGAPNKAWKDKTGKVIPGQNQYTTKPDTAANAMRQMLAAHIPYSIAWQAIYQFAKLPNSRWADALAWNPKYVPPSGQGGATRGPGAR